MEKITIKDTDGIKNIIVQVNIKEGRTSVISSFPAWENLALLMEAIGVEAKVCENEGKEKIEIHKTISEYLIRVLGDYEIV